MTEPNGPEHADPLQDTLRAWGQRQREAAGPPPAVHATAARPRARRWTGPAAVAAAVVVVLAAVGAGGGLLSRSHHSATRPAVTIKPPAAPLTVATIAAVRPFLRDAALTRPLLLGGGTLRLDRPTSTGTVDEQRALALWRSGTEGAGGTTGVADVVLTRATITLTVPVNAYGAVPGGLRPARPAVFARRSGWVVFSDGGVYSCPALTAHSPLPPGPPVLRIWLLSADGTAAADYTTAGREPCGGVDVAPAATASGYTSVVVPGRNVAANRTCTVISGTASGTGGSTSWALTLLATPPCTGGNLGAQQRPGALAVTRVDQSSSSETGLTYFDGSTRHAP